MFLRTCTTTVVLLLALTAPARACLRPSADARAIQWSTLIVQAKLASVASPVDLTGSANSAHSHPWRFQTYSFSITSVLDGSAHIAEQITVIRFELPDSPPDGSECGQSLAPDEIGKSFILLLRPETTMTWSTTGHDPRTAQIHDLKAFMIVNLESDKDLGPDGLTDLKNTISDTRKAEAVFTSDAARIQASALALAADDTEADQAEHSLLEMGPQALPAIKSVFDNTDDLGKTRLNRVISAITPPPITAVQ